MMQIFLQDLRYGVRMLLKNRSLTIIAIITLALGIGANTAIFSLVNTAMLRPLPIERPEELTSLNNTGAGRTFPSFSYPNYRDLRDRNEVFSDLIAYRFAPLSLSYNGANERLWGYVVSGNYFETLGVKAARGRLISIDDDRSPGAHPVAVLSYKSWQQRFGSAADIVGRELLVNGRGYTVIGVAADGFDGTEIIASPEIWFPMAMQAQIEVGDDWLEKRGVENIFLQGRLKPGVSNARAQAALDSISLQLAGEFPEVNEGKRITLAKPGLMGGMMRGSIIGFSAGLMIVVGLVLLLACINLANLLLARATDRRKEIAVRLALGANRFQLVKQLLTESVLLALLGGALGLFMAYWLVDLVRAFKPPIDVPLSFDLHIDHRVLIFTCLVSFVTGILFGLLPALQATKTDLVTALKDEMPLGGVRRSWWKSGLIVFQVALSLLLLIGGGLMLRGLQRAQTLDLGFNPQNAVEASFDLRLQGYDDARGREFQKTILERVRAIPGVKAAGIANMVPVDLHFGSQRVFIEGQEVERPANAPRVFSSRVSTGYFGAMETRILQGRDFTEQDNEQAVRVAIVNETFARRFWPGDDPIGKRFSMGRADAPKMQVIGIAQNGKYAGLNEDPKSFVYQPLWQSYTGSTNLLVRAEADPQRLIASIRGELRQLDPHLPISSAKTMVDHMAMPLLPARVAASLFGSFGMLALALAAIGLYGVMSFSVSKRTREIGIRMALGARSGDVLKMIVGQGMTLTVIGVLIGLLLAFGSTRLMKSLLFGVSPTDPLTFIVIALLLSLVALLACWLPARRASKTDPMNALRCE
jgi:predicted permease